MNEYEKLLDEAAKLNPPNDENFDRKCPYCNAEVPYFGMPWMTVTSHYDGKPVRRRMGPCPSCKKWVKAVLCWPDEGDGVRGWCLEPLHALEVEQAVHDKEKD